MTISLPADSLRTSLGELALPISQDVQRWRKRALTPTDAELDWDQVKTLQDAKKHSDRTASIVSVMEKEVLSKHRKALMQFGTVHLFHGQAIVKPCERFLGGCSGQRSHDEDCGRYRNENLFHHLRLTGISKVSRQFMSLAVFISHLRPDGGWPVPAVIFCVLTTL
jgi:hypothetical protein